MFRNIVRLSGALLLGFVLGFACRNAPEANAAAPSMSAAPQILFNQSQEIIIYYPEQKTFYYYPSDKNGCHFKYQLPATPGGDLVGSNSCK